MKQKLSALVFSALCATFFIFTTHTAQATDTIYVVGDSIAVGIVTTNRVASGGSWSNGGDNVTEVSRLVDRLIAARQIQGSKVILSSGASNSTFQTRTMRDDLTDTEIAVIGRQIEKLKNAGATVYLVGTGSTISIEFPKTRYVDGPYQVNFAQQRVNERLSALASSKGATFLGSLESYGLSSDKLHPSTAGYRALYNAVANGSGAAPAAPSNQPPASDHSNFTQPRDPSLIQGVVSGRGLIPCGRSGEQGEDSQPCTACHAVLAGKTLLDYLTSIMTVVAVAIIVAMGVLYIISGVNTSLKETAKKGLWAVLVGLIFMLSAWLIVNTVLRFLATDDFQQGGGGFIGVTRGDGIFGLQCNTTSDAGTAVMMQGGRVLNTGGSQGGGTSETPRGTASCSAITDSSNACSVRTLSAGCFGANGEVMSRVCNLESANGTVGIRSGSDVCGNYERRSFSGGLFQINVFSNGQHLGRECQNLGSKGSCVTRRGDVCVNWRCNIPDVSRFDRCMQQTLTAEGNIQIACAISRNGQDRTPWACTANRCGVGGVLSSNPRVRNMCL